MSFMKKFIYSGLITYLIVGIIFILFGMHLIINNKIVTINLSQAPSIFTTKVVKREKKEIKLSKNIFSRIFIYFAGCSFTIGGIMALVKFIKGI